MRRLESNRVSVFNLSGSRKALLPTESGGGGGGDGKGNKKKNQQALVEAGGLELVQDLDFPDFARCIFRTEDGRHLFAAGEYPPRLKCYDLEQMAMKFEFNADIPIVGGVSLSPDFRRFACYSDNRQITVHNTAHIVDRLRVPHTQRCMGYHLHTAELMSGGNSSEVFRIRLDSGAFVESFKTCSEEGVNAVDFFRGHGLVLTGGDNGVVEAWDPRAPTDKPVGAVNVAALDEVSAGGDEDDDDDDDDDGDGSGSDGGKKKKNKKKAGAGVTSLAVDDDSSYVFCAGTSTGQVAVFDIRSQRPLRVKDHMAELPIVRIVFHRDQQTMRNSRVISADKRTVKIWDRDSGANMTAVEAPNADIFDVVVCKQQHNLMVPPYRSADSGVLMIACDAPKVQCHFIPDLGRAPSWCTFLDSMAESFDEEEITTIYDDFKFVPSEEAKTLGITETAISAGKVRPAMHGFFVELGLYRDLKAIADPGAWARQVQEGRQAKRKEKLDNRISSFKRIKQDSDEDDDDAPGGNSKKGNADGSTYDMKQLIKSLPQDVRPLLNSMTPDTLELLARDPRFSSKVGRGKFTFDAKNPEFVKLFRQIGEKRKDAAERRERYDQSHFKVVPAAGAAAASTSSSGNDNDEGNRSGKRGDDEEDHWTRNALRQTAGKRRARSDDVGQRPQNQQAQQQQQLQDPRRLNLALIQQQQRQQSRSASSSGSGGATTLLMEAGRNTATTSSEKTMHQLRKLQRHKAKLTLEERLKRM